VLPLEGRDVDGNPVAANDTNAVFEYDPNLNITWLRNWNVNGHQDWSTQVAWAGSLTYFGGGWRLPKTTQPDASCSGHFNPGAPYPIEGFGYNCTGSEMGYLWYIELGNVANSTTNTGDFINLQPHPYWSGTELVWDASNGAWAFRNDSGEQLPYEKQFELFAVAVRDGDVAEVLEPDSDGDGVLDSIDLCPNTPADDTVNAYGCSIPQLVPCAGPVMGGEWRNHGQYVSTVTHVAQVFLKDDLISEDEMEALVSEVARSDCGKKEKKK
jgi:hypothetical protein